MTTALGNSRPSEVQLNVLLHQLNPSCVGLRAFMSANINSFSCFSNCASALFFLHQLFCVLHKLSVEVVKVTDEMKAFMVQCSEILSQIFLLSTERFSKYWQYNVE